MNVLKLEDKNKIDYVKNLFVPIEDIVGELKYESIYAVKNPVWLVNSADEHPYEIIRGLEYEFGEIGELECEENDGYFLCLDVQVPKDIKYKKYQKGISEDTFREELFDEISEYYSELYEICKHIKSETKWDVDTLTWKKLVDGVHIHYWSITVIFTDKKIEPNSNIE